MSLFNPSQSKVSFSIFVKVLDIIQLILQKRMDSYDVPKMKLIVADQTGVAVLYMRYYPALKKRMCLKLNNCQLFLNSSNSYQISHRGKFSNDTFILDNYLLNVNTTQYLSTLIKNNNGKLRYPISNSGGLRLSDITRLFYQKGSIQMQLVTKHLIVTIVGKINENTLIIGDYSGKLRMNINPFIFFTKQGYMKGDTFILIKPFVREYDNGKTLQIYINQSHTRVIKSKQNWSFKHDLDEIPDIMLSKNNYND